ncbi:MAG: protein translocase subunit SecF [Candidatus Sericytochromatia bacterium]
MKDYKIIKYRYIWFSISLALLIPGIIALIMGWMKPGLDFVGGTAMELKFNKPPTVTQVQQVLDKTDKQFYGDAIVQPSDTLMTIKAKSIDNKQQTTLFDNLRKDLGDFKTEKVEVVGPTIGKELFTNSMLGFGLVITGIILYLSFQFKYDYAICAIIALVHDVLFLVGTFALFGKLFGMEVDSLFVTAALTVAGFSVHDTIVVYDRIRENSRKAKRGTPIAEVANDSLNQTMTRSINTSLSVLITLLFLLLFGGETIKDFVLAMFIGIAAGTYSSIFIASPLLVTWREVADGKGSKSTNPA